MNFGVLSSNPEIAHKLTFLFFDQIEEELQYIFQKKGKYVVEYDKEGGVLGLTLLTTTMVKPGWQTIDTVNMTPYQCLNRIAMIHLMCFFDSPADFSDFNIVINDEIRCVCGADSVKTTHSSWCDKHDQ